MGLERETCTIRVEDDIVRQAEHSITISPRTKEFTVRFQCRMKLSLYLLRCLLLLTSFKQDEISSENEIKQKIFFKKLNP